MSRRSSEKKSMRDTPDPESTPSPQLDSVTRSLRQTAERVAGIEDAAVRLAAGGSEHVAHAEQARVAIESIVARIDETATATEQLTRSQAATSATVREL